MATVVAKELAERRGIGVRAGCHCAHLLIKHLLHIPPPLAMLQRVIVTLFPQVSLPGVARVSLGIENSAEDIDTLGKIARQPRSESKIPSLLHIRISNGKWRILSKLRPGESMLNSTN